MNIAAVNRDVQISLKMLRSVLLGTHPEAELLSHVAILFLIFLRNHHTVFHGSYF